MNDYALWYTDIHPSEVGFEITRKIAAHLALRITWGNAVIVCDTPHNLLPTLKKRREKVLQVIEAEYAVTKGNTRAETKRYLKTLEAVSFMAESPDDNERVASTVWLVDLDDFQKLTPSVETIYVMTTELTLPQLLFWTRQIKDGGQMVLFRKEPLGYVTNKRKKMSTREKAREEKVLRGE